MASETGFAAYAFGLAFTFAFTFASAADAQPSADRGTRGELAAGSVTLVVKTSDVDAERLSAAIARELDRPVIVANDEKEGVAVGGDVVIIDVAPDHQASVRVRSSDGRNLERTIELPQDPERAEETLALLVGNLVRNEAAEIARGLTPKRPPIARTEPTPPRAAEAHPATPCAPADVLVGVDLLPGVGSSLVQGTNSIRRFSFNALGTYDAGLDGFELSGIFNLESMFVCGTQLAGAANVSGGSLRGLQLSGLANVARDVNGVQFGVVNVATADVRGVQFGVFNYADDSDLSFGLVSIVRGGRTKADVWGLESGFLMLALKHGGSHFHNIYGAGARLVDGRFTLVFGFGGHFPVSEKVYVDIDAISYWFDKTWFKKVPTNLDQLRPSLGLRVAKRLSIFVGPTANLAFDISQPSDADVSPLGAAKVGLARLWPGVSAGIEVF